MFGRSKPNCQHCLPLAARNLNNHATNEAWDLLQVVIRFKKDIFCPRVQIDSNKSIRRHFGGCAGLRSGEGASIRRIENIAAGDKVQPIDLQELP
jgi:hypothetical protein